MIAFIYPSDPFNPKQCDPDYAEEYLAMRDAKFSTYLVDVDNIASSKIVPPIENDEQNINYIYRGWMLNPEQYTALEKKFQHKLVVSLTSYLSSHYLPSWYHSVEDLTMKSIITDEAQAVTMFKKSGWDKAFIKDYVKSLKTGKGSIVDSITDVDRALKDMKRYRGCIEGGVVLREVKNLLEDSEKRIFILNDKIYSNEPLSSDMQNVVEEVKKNHREFFYSVDLAYDHNKKLYLIEIGDGQVSGLVGWNTENFVNIFNDYKLNNNKSKKFVYK